MQGSTGMGLFNRRLDVTFV